MPFLDIFIIPSSKYIPFSSFSILLKNIIFESGVKIDKMVVKPGTKDEMVHFSDLCKTGKVLNTYNAFLLAKKISREKTSESK